MTSPPSRVWTIEEANAVLPQVNGLLERQFRRAQEIENCWQRLQAKAGPVKASQEGEQLVIQMDENASPEAKAIQEELYERIVAYEGGWKDVEELGLVIKDPRTGLCDFYGRMDGKLVWLCWRYGEKTVEFYHELDSGFSGRKAITADARQRALN